MSPYNKRITHRVKDAERDGQRDGRVNNGEEREERKEGETKRGETEKGNIPSRHISSSSYCHTTLEVRCVGPKDEGEEEGKRYGVHKGIDGRKLSICNGVRE